MRSLLLVAVSMVAAGQPLTGIWDGRVTAKDLVIPFRIEFTEKAGAVQASFFNGEERVTSTSGKRDGNAVTVQFDHYATKLEATLADGKLTGQYGGRTRARYAFEAEPHREPAAVKGYVPSISGVWELPVESAKGERAWRLIVRQEGPNVTAAILRVDGDTGALTGRWEDGRFVLSHFSGARPSVAEITPDGKGKLNVVLRTPGGSKTLTAVAAAEARTQGLPTPTDPALHTRLKNPDEPLRFRFPDLDGKTVANTDDRFLGKVVIVNVTGSWCPNCHDEAPFLEELYRKYHSLGLEIVALDFEEAEQLAERSRVKAFIKRYGIGYTYLIAGEPGALAEAIPQAENLNAWPTTFFVGRDGRVRSIHAGFAAAASGEFHVELKREVTDLVERLLGESERATR